ncbi:IucA/IucC family siderophore biosynthesis protein [Micromonospora sp. CPCC 205539]|uniref:IucA/IucC family siderophore biosynthesis protein n=1 Tax=Micromonospora sp. CPCC 205539 TaxID=3122408 RepID=UPI002FEED18B
MSDDCERQVFTRVLDALLREDHLGLLSRGRSNGPDWWEVPHAAGLLRIPVRADGFQHALRSAAPMVQVVVDGDTRRTDTVDGLLTVLAPHGSSEAEAGWRNFGAECRADLRARRLAARTRPGVLSSVAAERATTTTGMAAALLDDVLAAHHGHPVYPTDRCRHGLSDDELLRYAPEHAPRLPLRWYAADADAVRLTGDLPASWPPAPRPDQLLLPVHPLTAARDALPVTDLPLITARPTLSMRTVALDHDPYLHLKLPLPTATLGARNRRTLHPDTLADGAAVAGLLDRIAAADPAFAGRIRHADESTYATIDERRGFLLRRFPRDLSEVQVVPVAALAAPDPVAGTVLERISPGRPEALLDAYLDLLLDWHVCLWLRHGVALEAHPQNIYLLVHPDGTVGLLYKDNDGARLDLRHAGPDGLPLRDDRMWVRDPQELADVFITITLHLAAAAPLLALAARGLPVPTPAAALAPRLAAARDRWGDGPAARSLTERVLTAARLPIKAMLTAGTLLPKQRLGCDDINKYYRRTGPNYLRETR